MKKIYAGFTLFVLLSSTALVQADVSILNSSATGISFALEIPEPDFEEKIILGNVYTAIAGSQGKLHPGAPDLPAYGTWILVPNGAEVIITTDPGEAKVYDNIKLPPVQPPRPESGLSYNNELFIDTGIYARNQPYPGLWSEAENTKQKRGQDCTIIWFYPFQYNPQSEQLSFYPDLRVDVDFRGGNGQKAVNQGDHTIDLYSFAVNAEDILNAISTGTPPLQIRSDGYDMIIITPAEFEASAELLAEWKKRKGITTRIVTTDLLGYDAEAVDQYIADAFYNWDPAPSYLLLLGDAELVPTWYENEHVSGGDQGYTAADIYFADVNEPPDLVADLSYGRIPVDTVADADSAVHRIIAYERNPPLLPLYYSWATAACYFQDDDQNTYADRRFAKTSEDIRNFLTENSYDVERIYFTEYANDPRYWNANDYVFENDGEGGEPLPAELLKPAFPWDGNAADVINAVNRGSFLLIHRDHGFREGWGEPYFDVNHVNMLGNGNLRPVVWTINCCTGWFDNETDAAACGTGFNDECFVEHWMRHLSGGSMGLMGATRISFSGNNDRLAWGFMDALWPGFLEWCNVDYPEHYPLYKMGDVLNYGKEYMMANYTWSEYRTTTLEEFSWFGDPTLELWTSYPDYMTVMHDPEIILGSTEFMVFCDLDGARAVLLQSDQILDIAPVFNGTALLEFPQVNSLDSLELSITAHDYFPYSAFIPAVAEGPFVVCDSVYFQENGPYNDGCLQSLDFLDLDLQITNIGISPTPDDLTLQLLTDSDMVNVIIGETAAEMMAAGETQTIAAAFQIELLAGIPSGEILTFTLNILSSNYEWQDQFFLQCQGPVISYYNYIMNVLDGDDQILDPGETAEIYLIYENSGNGYSYSLFSSLFSFDSYASISGTDMIPQIAPGTTVQTILPFTVQIDAACPIEYNLQLDIFAYDILGNALTEGFTIPIGFWEETFETGEEIWIHESLEENYLDEWHLTDYRNYTSNGFFSMKCGGAGAQPYSNNNLAALYMPSFDNADGQHVTFYHWLNTGILPNNQAWDGGIIEISDNGTDFVQLEPIGGYPCTLLNLPGLPFPGGTGVFAGDIQWEQVELDLTPYSGNIQLRFVFGSSPGLTTGEGWYIDDVHIVNYQTAVEDQLIPVYNYLYKNYPNPFNPETEISYTLAEPGDTYLIIYNLKGQKVRSLVHQKNQAAGKHSLIWDGNDNRGLPVPSGIYFYSLQTQNFHQTRKMILIK